MTRLLQRDHVRALKEAALVDLERIDAPVGDARFRAHSVDLRFTFLPGAADRHPTMRITLVRQDGHRLELRIPRPVDETLPLDPGNAAMRLAVTAEALTGRSATIGSRDERMYRIARLIESLLDRDDGAVRSIFVHHRSPLGHEVVSPDSFPEDWTASVSISGMLPVGRMTKATMTAVSGASHAWTIMGLPSRRLSSVPGDAMSRLRAVDELISRHGLSPEAIGRISSRSTGR